jgi:RNA polymerase sigma factor (sigma-70 family)
LRGAIAQDAQNKHTNKRTASHKPDCAFFRAHLKTTAENAPEIDVSGGSRGVARGLRIQRIMSNITLSSGIRGRGLPHADFVRRACLRYVQNRDEANDLAQDVLLKVTSKGWEFAGASHPATWLYRVAINHCLDHLRREKRLREQAETYAAQKRSEYEGEDEEGLAGIENERVRRVLGRLRECSGETDRQVIYLRFDLDLSLSAIAEILGVTKGAAAQRLQRIQARASHLWNEEA